MEVMRMKDLVKDAPNVFKQMYCPDQDHWMDTIWRSKEKTYRKLKRRCWKSEATKQDVIDICGGDDILVRMKCWECEHDKDMVIRIGEPPNAHGTLKPEANTTWLCIDCLKKALELLKQEVEKKK